MNTETNYNELVAQFPQAAPIQVKNPINRVVLSAKEQADLTVLTGHPAEMLRRYIDAARLAGNKLTFRFKSIELIPGDYTPNGVPDYHDADDIEVPGDELGGEELKEFFRAAADDNFDVVLTSKVIIEPITPIPGYGQSEPTIMHIPMIDGECDIDAPILKDTARDGFYVAAGLFTLPDFEFYASGRSFHGYGASLIPESQFPSYLGQLLLLNQPGKQAIVDSRWVGHSIMMGSCGLRWTANNTEKYKQIPAKMKNPFAPAITEPVPF